MVQRLLVPLLLAALACRSDVGDGEDRAAEPAPSGAAEVPAPSPEQVGDGPAETEEAPFARFELSGSVERRFDEAEALLGPGPDDSFELAIEAREGLGAVPAAALRLSPIPRSGERARFEIVGPGSRRGPGQVSASLITESDRVGTLRDFREEVSGTLFLDRRDGFLEGQFHLEGAEAPPPEAEESARPTPYEPPLVEEPGRIRAVGVFRARIPTRATPARPS